MDGKAISRAQTLILILVVAVAAGAYFAATSIPSVPTGPGTTTATSVPNPDTIIQELAGSPSNLDPAIDYEYFGYNEIINVYEPLLQYPGEASDADQLIPWLAESYDVSPGGLTYTFHLRDNIRFSDGTPLDAQAVWYSYMRVLIMDDPGSAGWFMVEALRGAANYSKSYNNAGPSAPDGYGDAYTQAELDDLLNAKPIEVIDPMTVAFHLERQYADWPWIMAYVFGPVSPTAFKAHWTAPTDGTPYIEGATAGDYQNVYNPWAGENMVGTGPYMLSSWDKESGTVVLVRNENYWGGPSKRGLAPVKTIVTKLVVDTNTRVLDLKTGTADTADIPPAGEVIYQFVDKDTWVNEGKLKATNPDYGIYPQCPPHELVQGKCLFLLMGGYSMLPIEKAYAKWAPTRELAVFQPFQDLRIRKAFDLSINRTAFLHEIMQDFAIQSGPQTLPPQVFGYDPSIQPIPYDPEQAKQLLVDAGTNPISPDNSFSPEKPKTVQVYYNLGQLDQEQMAVLLSTAINSLAPDTGLYAEAIGLARSQFVTSYRQRRCCLYMIRGALDYPGPDNQLAFVFGRSGAWTRYAGYENEEVFRLVGEQSRTLDSKERLNLIRQITELTNADHVYFYLGARATLTISRSWLHERPGATIASGLETFNPGVTNYFCCYFYEVQKGESQSSASVQPSLLDLIQLPAVRSTPKESF